MDINMVRLEWVLALLAAFTVALALLFARLGRRGRICLGIACVVGVVCASAFYPGLTGRKRNAGHGAALLSYEDSAPREGPHTREIFHGWADNFVIHSSSPSRTEVAWSSAETPGFKPDVYPSARAAARGLAAEAMQSMAAGLSDGQAVESIDVRGTAASIALAAADELRRLHPSAKIQTGASASGPAGQSTTKPGINLLISVEVTCIPGGRDARAPTSSQPQAGTVRLGVRGPAGEHIYGANFVDKPWFENFAEFVGSHPQSRWILAQSPGPVTGPSEAEQAALRDGAAKLVPDVGRRVARGVTGPWASMISRNRAKMEETIRAELLNHVADRFVQGFSRPYGQVWRQAVLIDASDSTLASLASACGREVRSERRNWVKTVASLGGLFTLICVVYAFLNVVTKGYYVRALRAVVAGMVLAGIAATLLVARYAGG